MAKKFFTDESLTTFVDEIKSYVDSSVSTKANSSHTHTIANITNLQSTLDSKTNQNAFSNIAVSGQTTVAADTATDTVTFAGSNVTITTDATNDKVTFTVADGSTSAKGVVKLENSTSSTSTTTAATPSSVKSAYDLANTAKTNAATAQTKADSAYTLAESKVDSLSDLGITATAAELNYIDGVTSNVQTQLDAKVSIDHIHPYGVCSTAADTAAKTVTVNGGSGFTLTTGAKVVIKFTVTNTASSITLNVNSTGAKPIHYRGTAIYTSYIAANKVYEFVYDGTNWVLVGDNITGLMTTSNPSGTGTISMNRKANTTIGTKSVAMGNNVTASGTFSVALGTGATASAEAAFAEGDYTTASGQGSHAEGYKTTASGNYSHSEGINAKSVGESSHAEGGNTEANGNYSHAEGYTTEANGVYSHAEGYFTKASSDYQHVQGIYNIEDANSKYIHIVGNGRDDAGSVWRSNAHTIDWNGNGWFAGNVYVGGEDQDDDAASRVITEADHEWSLIHDSGSITSRVNSISNINVSGYKKLLVVVKCVNSANSTARAGSVILKSSNGTTYQFPVWTNLFTTSAGTAAGMAEFHIIDRYIICPYASRNIKTNNFMASTEGGTADNLTNTGGGILKCTNAITSLTVSSLDQDSSFYFESGSRVYVWGCNA